MNKGNEVGTQLGIKTRCVSIRRCLHISQVSEFPPWPEKIWSGDVIQLEKWNGTADHTQVFGVT